MPTSSSTARDDPSPQPCGDPALLRALAAPAMYRGHPEVTVHETHASWVFVAGDRAYKVKKPIALGFLDYSTLERRRSACREEVRVNRELAPDLYLGVRAITSSQSGFRFASEEAKDALEYVVEMRRFSDQDTFAGLIATGSLTRAHVARQRAGWRTSTVARPWWPIGVPIACSRCGGGTWASWGGWITRPRGSWTSPPGSVRPSWRHMRRSSGGGRCSALLVTVTGTCAVSMCWRAPPSAWSTGSSSTPGCARRTSPATWPSWRWISRRRGSAGRPASSQAPTATPA